MGDGLQGRISYGGIGGLDKKLGKQLRGDMGYRPNFKHDYEEKTVKTYGGIGGTPVFSKKNYGGIGGQLGL